VTVDAASAGAREARLTYLTGGLSWKADYVSIFDERTNRMDMQGWITLQNQSGVTYENAETRLVAGDVTGAGGGGPQPYDQRRYRGAGIPPPPPPPPPRGGMVEAGTESGQGGQTLGDYYIYPLPERTTIAQNQTKQVSFLDVKTAEARRAYLWRSYGFASMEQPQALDSVLEFSNASGAGLGAQLPAGIVRVYQRDVNGTPQFVGENQITHTPQGSAIAVKTGQAFDLTVQSTLVNEETANDFRTRRYDMRYVFRNARARPQTVTLWQSGMGASHRVLRESVRSRTVDTATRAWDVQVPANGEATLTFSVETRW
jgi:hypothetical protein